ncbi:hypothetical protein, partial [Pelomicrobium sp. G1]|uniref:hypothetical protein n=1 Tax=Pelomicrobium sp. G1 TaxID=3452920 RepID=UPI003F7578B9
NRPMAEVRPLLQVIGEPVSRDTVALLEELLDSARKGSLTGLALVAMHKHRCYEFAITGEAARSPTFALGAVTKLQLHLSELMDEGE